MHKVHKVQKLMLGKVDNYDNHDTPLVLSTVRRRTFQFIKKNVVAVINVNVLFINNHSQAAAAVRQSGSTPNACYLVDGSQPLSLFTPTLPRLRVVSLLKHDPYHNQSVSQPASQSASNLPQVAAAAVCDAAVCDAFGTAAPSPSTARVSHTRAHEHQNNV